MIENIIKNYGKEIISLLTNAGYGLCLTDQELKIVWKNEIFDEWFQNNESNLIFVLIENISEKDRSQIYNSLIVEKRNSLEIKYSPGNRWFQISLVPIHTPESLYYYFFLLDDITEKKLVFESYISQLDILDNVEDGIYSTDFENRVIFWNKGAEKIYGYTAKEVIGKVINKDFLLYDQFDEETQIQITNELERYRTYYFKRKEYNKENKEIWIEGNVTLISDTGDSPIGLLYIIRDVTGKLNSEFQNYLNANLQKSLREITANLVADFSFSDLVLQVTKKCKELTESEICAIFKVNEHRSEIIEIISDVNLDQSALNILVNTSFSIRSWLELNKIVLTSFGEYPGEIIEELNKVFGKLDYIIVPVVIKNELEYFILTGANYFYLPRFKVEIVNSFASLLSYIITYYDKKLLHENLEEKLKQIQKYELTSNLISGIVHDFKNLLYGIKVSLELIKQKNTGTLLENTINEIDDLLDRGIDLSKSLLEVGKPLRPVKSEFKLNKLLDDVYNLACKLFQGKVIIEKNYSEDLPKIFADYSQLHQVLVNLLLNANDSISENGLINIGAKEIFISEREYIENPKIKFGDYVVISIKDNGVGIPNEYLEKIFEPYFTTKGSKKGTGLGLFISQSIINKHNGLITVESEVGKGTTFHIYLPIVKSESLLETEKVKAQKVKADPVIFIIDDEDAIRNLLSEMLSLQNFKVIEAASGQDAIDLFSKFQDSIDLIILDYYLKDMTGEQLLRHIREINSDLPVFIASGIIDDELSKRLYELKVDKIIEKPFAFDILMEGINNYIKIRSD